jgi:hypothetical protein
VDRLMIAVLAGIFGLIVGLLAPGLLPVAQDVREAENVFLNPPTPGPPPTPTGLANVPRTIAVPTSVPPTLTRPAKPLAPLATATQPTVQTFVIKLKGGGEMHVNASDLDAAINNVKASGAIPADQP